MIAALSAPQTGEAEPPKGYQPPACPPPTTPAPTPPPCPRASAAIAAPPGVKGYAPPACPPPATTTTTTTTEPPCVRTTTAAPCPYRTTPSPCPCAQTTTVAPCNQPVTTLPPIVTSPHSKGYPQPHPNSLQRSSSSRVSSSLVGPSPQAGVYSSFISEPQPAGMSSLASSRSGQMRFYQSFQPRGDRAILSPLHGTSFQSSYSEGARRDSSRIENIQSDQPSNQQVEIGTRGQHLRQEMVDQVLLSSDQEIRRSLNRMLGSTIHRKHQRQPNRRSFTRRTFSVPKVQRR